MADAPAPILACEVTLRMKEDTEHRGRGGARQNESGSDFSWTLPHSCMLSCPSLDFFEM